MDDGSDWGAEDDRVPEGRGGEFRFHTGIDGIADDLVRPTVLNRV